ncbi:dUTPase-like protein [Bisporella sp. PMI_857]|nr:dUTPase-like protein [Bisporella sp. PMI_857]
MSTPPPTTIHSPLNSPLPKRQKPNPTSPPPASTTSMTPAVTKVEDAPALLIKKLSDKARLPTRGSAFAAGYDIYASKEAVVPARGKVLVDTDISMAVPAGTYGRIAPRSGLASKHFIDTGAGVIDADYRGQVKILLFNHSETDFEIKEGDRVAQLVLERIYTPEVVEVQELEESVRGAGGFGSTG